MIETNFHPMQRQNYDDVLLRSILSGVLNAFYDKVYWNSYLDGKATRVNVPVFFSFGGSERVIYDRYFDRCEIETNNLADGFYSVLPRAVISMESVTINQEYLTNPYIRMNYTKNDDGEVKEYNAQYRNIPLTVSMNCTFLLDSTIDMFKCTEAIINKMYKNQYFYVNLDGTKIYCYFSIPEDLQHERTMNYSFNDKKEYKITLPLEVAIDYPSIDTRTEMFAGEAMETIEYTIISKPTGLEVTRTSL